MNVSLIEKAAYIATCRQRQIVHLCAALIVIGGTVYSVIKGCGLNFPDERQYFAIAMNIASGHGFSLNGTSPTALFPPGWPFLLAVLIKIGASCTIIHITNFIFLACSIYVISSILKHEDASIGTAISALLIPAYCVLFYTAGTLYPQTFFTLILLLLVRSALDAANSLPWALLFGLLCGALILVHSTGVFIPPVAGLWIIFSPVSSKERKKALLHVTIAAIVATIAVSAWTYRNYTVFHQFIPLTTHGGDTLYIGNNPHTSLSAWYNYVDDEFYKKVSRLPETQQNRHYVQKTLEFWTDHTGDAIRLYLVKLADYFNFYNNLFAAKFDMLKRVIMFVTYYPLLACFIIRLTVVKRMPLLPAEKLFTAIYLTSALFHAIFVPRIRFRLPYDVILITHIGLMFSILARNHASGLFSAPACKRQTETDEKS